MTAGMLSIVDRQGHVLEGTYQPTSELKMHLKIYEMRPDVNAVVHAHPPFATSFAVAGIPLDRYILAEAVFELGKVPIAPYATPSTDELTDSFVDLLSEHDCFLLKNHGATTMGIDLMTAYYKMESLEHLAKIMNYASSLGKMDEIPQDKVRVLEGMRQKYGIHADSPSQPYNSEIKPGTAKSIFLQLDEGRCLLLSMPSQSRTAAKPEISRKISSLI